MKLTTKFARLFTVLLVSSMIGWSTGCAEKAEDKKAEKESTEKSESTDTPEAGSNKSEEETKLPSE